MDLTQISTIIDKYGIKGAIFIIFIFIIYSAVKSEWFGNIVSKVSEKFIERFMKNKTKDLNTQVRNITDSDIINHDIFNYIDFWMYSKVPTFQFSTEYRTAVFRKYLAIYLRNYKKDISSFVNNNDYKTMDDAKVWKALLNLINSIVYDYEKEMIESGLPKIVVDKMKAKNNDTITLTIDLIEGICNSQFYDSEKNFLKVYSILNILLSVLENTISNSENVCNSINGQLKGLKFDGKVEP
jgi:hypothetical protein